MFSVLPEVLFLAPFSAFLIRVALALALGYAALKHYSGGAKLVWLAVLEAVAAVSIAVGAWTQVGAIAGAIVILLWFSVPHLRPVARGTALLSLVLALSLIVTGAGAFAFDLPL